MLWKVTHINSGNVRYFENASDMQSTLDPVREFWVVSIVYPNGFETEPQPL